MDERLTLAEAAELTGLTPRALARRIERGSLPAEKNENGRRTVTRHDLAAVGLLDLVTGKAPAWNVPGRPPSGELARAVLEELTARGVRIYELERRLAELSELIEEERKINEEQQRQLDQAKRERAELRRQMNRRS
jgi:hypothetical protein